MSEHNLIRVTAFVKMNDQSDVILEEVNIPLRMPKLLVKVTTDQAYYSSTHEDEYS